ncbi:hypothetical protein BDN72DRAFT_898336, partial [Pluteus cervinus]
MSTSPSNSLSLNEIGETTKLDLANLLPELLFQILTSLDDLSLYHLSAVCGTFNQLSLDILFKRYCPDVSKGELNLNASYSRPSILLPALHRALYLHVPRISMAVLPKSSPRLLAEFRMLKDIVVRQSGNEALSINLTSSMWANDGDAVRRSLEELKPGLRGLVDAAMKKGCKKLNIDTGIGFKFLYFDRPIPFRAREVAISGEFSPHLIGTAILNNDDGIRFKSSNPEGTSSSESPFGTSKRTSFSSKVLNKFKRLVPSKNATNPVAGEVLAPDLEEPQPQNTPVQRAHPKSEYKGRVELSADLFTPTWLDWTLKITNDTTLVHLVIKPTRASKPYTDVWHNILPSIYAPHLEWFEFSTYGLGVEDLVSFVRRHATTLQCLRLSFTMPESMNSSRRLMPEPSLAIPEIYLPRLHTLCLPPHSISPFLGLIKPSFLPDLQCVNIQPPLVEWLHRSFGRSQVLEHHLNDALESLGKFSALYLDEV